MNDPSTSLGRRVEGRANAAAANSTATSAAAASREDWTGFPSNSTTSTIGEPTFRFEDVATDIDRAIHRLNRQRNELLASGGFRSPFLDMFRQRREERRNSNEQASRYQSRMENSVRTLSAQTQIS